MQQLGAGSTQAQQRQQQQQQQQQRGVMMQVVRVTICLQMMMTCLVKARVVVVQLV
jgi:hypothetical protein